MREITYSWNHRENWRGRDEITKRGRETGREIWFRERIFGQFKLVGVGQLGAKRWMPTCEKMRCNQGSNNTLPYEIINITNAVNY